MKRLFILISVLFLSVSSFFAKDPSLFDWNITRQELVTTFLNEGWKITYNEPFINVEAPSNFDGKMDNFPYLRFTGFTFGFNKNNKLVVQSLNFEEELQKFVFADILEIACNDKAKLTKATQRKVDNNAYDFSYYGVLPGSYVMYSAIGNSDYMQLILTYSLDSLEG
jgi:hypothetical protein